MAKDVDLTSREWSDIVFEGRNKDFGAYVLRTESKPRHLKAFICTIIGIAIIGAATFTYLKYQDFIAAREAAITDQAQQELVAFVDETPEEEEEEIQEKVEMPEPEALPEEILNTVKVTELLIAKDEEVTKEDEIKTVDELKETETAFGSTDFDKGTDDRNVVREYKNEVIVEEKKPEPEQVFTAVEQMPMFPGGDAALMKFLSSNINYPQVAMENGVQGRVIVQFVVTKNGSVGEVKVIRSVDRDLDKEAIRLCKSLPKFIPGKMNGQEVNVWYTLPITFKLQGLN